MKTNTYYVYRNNNIVEDNINNIAVGETFFYVGRNSDFEHDVFFVFAVKEYNRNQIIEVEQSLVGQRLYTLDTLSQKFEEYEKSKSYA